MKLADAEVLLQAVKDEGPITERWWCETDEGILLEAWPLGFARGSWGLRDLITVMPRLQYSALFEGAGVPHVLRVPRLGPNHLWEQEAFVYYREMREQMAAALYRLEDGACFPRAVGEYDETPHKEDFRLFSPATSAVHWHYQGKRDIEKIELQVIKLEFMELLKRFSSTPAIAGDEQGEKDG